MFWNEPDSKAALQHVDMWRKLIMEEQVAGKNNRYVTETELRELVLRMEKVET